MEDSATAAAGRITVAVGDITALKVDAIVNAANAQLSGGTGVNGAIRAAAGPGLAAECRGLGGCETGDAKVTGGHLLPAGRVVHAVGPIWAGGGSGEDGLLARCYRRSLEVAAGDGARTVAFPAISTGVYGFPPERAARVAVRAVADFLADPSGIEEVVLCCFSEESAELHRAALGAIGL